MTEEITEKRIGLGQNLSYGTPIIIFFGMTRLITFYNSFGVSIVSYLDFSEIITSFFDIIFIVVMFFACISIQNFLIGNKIDVDQAEKKRHAILHEDDFFKICKMYISYLKAILIFELVIVLGLVIGHFIFNWVTALDLYTTVSIFCVLNIFLIIIVEVERKHIHLQSTIRKRRFIFLTLYFLVFTMGVIFYSSYQAGLIKTHKSTYGVSFTLDNNEKVVSDSTSYFIGKTFNYLFIYHEKEKATDVIPMSRVKQITMKHNIR